MQVQNQTQQVPEEELLLPLSEDDLASITGGCIKPPVNLLDEARRELVRRQSILTKRKGGSLTIGG